MRDESGWVNIGTEHETDAAWLALLDELRAAYLLARGERSGELHGTHGTKGGRQRFDARGLHPYSEVWGRINMILAKPKIAETIAAAPDQLEVTPRSLREAAVDDANAEFARQIREES